MRRRHDHLGLIVRAAVVIVLALPLVWAVWASLQPVEAIFGSPRSESAGSSDWQWDNYKTALTRLPMWRFLLNSLFITSVATIGTIISCSISAFAFARLQWRGRRIAFVLALATMAVPLNLIILPQFLIFERLGWVNTYKPLIVPHWLAASGFFVFLFHQFFKTIPRDYEDAARLEGATNWHVYRHVMLPMSRPVIAAVAAISAVGHWNAFFAPLIYLSDFETYPVSVGLRMFQAMEGTWPNLMMAAAVMMIVPPLVIVWACQSWLMRSMED